VIEFARWQRDLAIARFMHFCCVPRAYWTNESRLSYVACST